MNQTETKLHRSEIFVGNRIARDSKLRRSDIFGWVKEYAAPTELGIVWIGLATKMSLLRSWADISLRFGLLRRASVRG